MAEISQRDQTQGSQFPVNGKTNGLELYVDGCNLNAANFTKAIAPVKVTLTDDVVNRVYVDWSDDTIKVTTGDFPKAGLDLYEITTVAGEISGLPVDCRGMMRISCHSEFFTLPDYVKSDDYNSNQAWTILDLSSVLPAGATTVTLRVGVRDSGVVPDNEVYVALKHPDDGDSAWSRMLKSPPIQSGVFMWYLWPVGLNDLQQLTWTCKVSGTMTIKFAVHEVAYG